MSRKGKNKPPHSRREEIASASSVETRKVPEEAADFHPRSRRVDESVSRALGLALCGSLGPRGFSGLPAGLAGSVALGRREPRDQAGTPLLARALSHLVRRGRDAAILPDPAQCLLDRAQALGRRHAGLSPGKDLSALPGGPDGGDPLAAAGDPGGIPGGGDLRAAPRAGGIGGLDRGAKEHPLGRLLPGRRHALPPLRPHAESGLVFGGLGVVRAGPVEQDGDGHASRGAVGDLLVAAGTVVVEARRAAACCRSSSWGPAWG